MRSNMASVGTVIVSLATPYQLNPIKPCETERTDVRKSRLISRSLRSLGSVGGAV